MKGRGRRVWFAEAFAVHYALCILFFLFFLHPTTSSVHLRMACNPEAATSALCCSKPHKSAIEERMSLFSPRITGTLVKVEEEGRGVGGGVILIGLDVWHD